MAKILIIDDDPIARELLRTVLGYAGHEFSEGADGAEGLVKARTARPDLIIADLLMPTMDGFEFVRRLREDTAFATTPVIFYSATYLESETRRLAALCGVEHIITKPAEPQEILATVGAALGSQQAPVPPLPLEEFHREHMGLLATKLSQRATEAVPRLDAMIDLSLQLASERDPKRLLETFCAAARKIIGARYSVVAVWEDGRQDMRYLFTSGMSRGRIPGIDTSGMRAGVLEQVLSERRPQRLSGLPGDPVIVGLPGGHPPVHAFLCAPIVSPEHSYGCVCLTDKLGATEFSQEDEGLTQILAAQVGRAYENGSLYSEVRTRAEDLEREISERKRAEDALRQSEERFSKAFRANLAGVAIYKGEDGRVIDVNERFCDFFGYGREEMIGRTAMELRLWANPEDRVRTMATVKDAGHILNVEARMRKKSGECRDALLSIETIELSGKPHHIAMLIDLTERKLLEEKLRQAQKMEAIGQLAGGVAHDFNNILTVILGNSLMIQGTENLAPAIADSVHQITQAAEHASTLTRQLLTFSRRQVIQPKNLDLNQVVGDTTKMLQRILGEDVELRFLAGPGLPHTCADPGMIEQVLMNLAVNSRDAMPKGGLLTIATDAVTVDRDYVRQNPEACQGEFLCLTVTDTGEGIPPEHFSKIFEPFFTTKEAGKGTGLGLATVYGIVKQHHGWIKVASEPKQGTTFTIYLPTAEGQADVQQQAVQTSVRGGSESILVVEDHPLLRSIVRKILERYGYRVFDAKSGGDALNVWNQCRNEIQLLLTDVVLPDGITGGDLAERLTGEKPDLKVIFTSGYSAEVVGSETLQEGVNFLQKPYDLKKVAETVRKCLDEKAALRGSPQGMK